MALPAGEAGEPRFAALAGLLRPRPGRLAFAARLALICVLTTLVCEIYGTPEPALTVYVVFFLNRPDRATSLLLNAAVVVVITLVIGLILVVANLVVDHAGWRVASMALISFGLLFLVSASKLRPVGATVALIVAYGLDLLGSIPVGEAATRGLLYGWLFAGIPAGVSIVVNLLLAPSPRQLAQRALSERLRLAAGMLRSPDRRTQDDFARCLRDGDAEIRSWLKLAGAERTSPTEDIAALRHAANATTAVLASVDFMARTPDAQLPESLRESLAGTLEQMAAILQDGGYPVNIALAPVAHAPLTALAAHAHALLAAALVRFAEPPATPPTPAASQPGGFFLPDAFSNPEHVRYALKTTAAAMVCYLLYSFLSWPGIHTCLLTCYIVSLGTVAESVEKLSLRIAGCLVGAAFGLAAMVFLVPSVTSIGGLLLVVFLGTLAAAWVAAGSPRIAYAGFQIAFAFLLCIVQGAGPSFDMVVARDRIVGILIGNLVVYLVSAGLWPVSVAARIESAITGLLQRLAAMATAPDASARLDLASSVQSGLGAMQDDLELARYEPASVRPSAVWLADRRRIARQLGALQAPLLLVAQHDHALAAATAGRLDRLAGAADAATPGRPTAAQHTEGLDPLRTLVEQRLRALKASLQPARDGDERTAAHAAA